MARPWKSFLAYYQNFTTASFEYQVNFGGRIVPSKRAASAIPLQMTKALPKEEVFFRYRDTEAEEVEPYALSKEGQEESRNEIEEVTQERLAAGETLDALENLLRRGERDIPMVIHPLPWDDEEPPPEGRALRKLPPPESAVKAEPEAKTCKTRRRWQEVHRVRHPISSMYRGELRKFALRRRLWRHLDEVVDVETLAIDDGEDEAEDLLSGNNPEELWRDEPLFRTHA